MSLNINGNPAVIAKKCVRPVALRPYLSIGLLFSILIGYIYIVA